MRDTFERCEVLLNDAPHRYFPHPVLLLGTKDLVAKLSPATSIITGSFLHSGFPQRVVHNTLNAVFLQYFAPESCGLQRID
jgi:hypothetical protein